MSSPIQDRKNMKTAHDAIDTFTSKSEYIIFSSALYSRFETNLVFLNGTLCIFGRQTFAIFFRIH